MPRTARDWRGLWLELALTLVVWAAIGGVATLFLEDGWKYAIGPAAAWMLVMVVQTARGRPRVSQVPGRQDSARPPR